MTIIDENEKEQKNISKKGFSAFVIERLREIRSVLNGDFLKGLESVGVNLDYKPKFLRSLFTIANIPPPPPYSINVEIIQGIIGTLPFFSLLYPIVNYFLSYLFPLGAVYNKIGIDSQRDLKIFALHDKKTIKWAILSGLVFDTLLPIAVLFAITTQFAVLLISMIPFLMTLSTNNTGLSSLAYALFLIIGTLYTVYISMVMIVFPLRLAFGFVNKKYAETICIRECAHILIDLEKDDIFADLTKKELLLYRIDYLAKIILLLGSRYFSDSKDNQEWIRLHFKNIESFLREREKWIIAPTTNTLQDLRRDFRSLANIFIQGNYGSIEWTKNEQAMRQTPIGLFRQFFISFVRLVMATLPLVLMGIYLLKPELFPFLHLDTTIVSFVFFAWLIMTVDINFKLGIVPEITKIAKDLKDLT